MPRLCAACLLLLANLSCTPEPEPIEPDFEWQGEWIDIWGFDTQPQDTCAGTFAYVDGYAGLIAERFGVGGHLGVYRWFSPERFADEDPCRNPGVLGCAGTNGAFAHVMPLEHEVVHVANIQSFPCPKVLSEGLAVHYSTTSETPSSNSDNLLALLENPATPVDSQDYAIAGAFVAFLVESWGLETVLESCRLSGPAPNAAEFAEAMALAFGAPLDELFSSFLTWRDTYGCDYSQYRSKLYECAQAPTVVVDGEPVSLPITLDCNDSGTIGPRYGEIGTLGSIRVVQSGSYLVTLEDDDGLFVEDLGFQIIECTSCKDAPLAERYPPDPELSGLWIIALDAGDYLVRVWGPPEATRAMTLTFTP